MLEMLVAGGGKPYYPNSGPGPKSLAGGNEQAGYFGTLTQAQLFTPTEIFNLLNIPTIGPSTDTSMIWCKFFYKGKIVYIPTRPINDGALQAFSWTDLYQLGLVYGTDSDGAFPSPVGSPVNQRITFSKTLEGKTAGFWPRFSAASDIDPTDTTSAGATGKGELAELLSNVYQLGFKFGTGKWDSLPTGSLEVTNQGMMRTSSGTGTGMIMGTTNGAAGKMTYSSSGKSVNQASWRWWPVLQYINPTENLLDLTNFKADSPPPKAVDLYAVSKGESVGGIIGVRNVRSDLLGGRVLPVISTALIKRPYDVKVGLLSPVPRIGATSTQLVGLRNPSNFTVGLVSEPPRPTVTTTPLFIAGAKVSYSPAPVTGIKLSDQ